MITWESNTPDHMRVILTEFEQLATSFREKGYFEVRYGFPADYREGDPYNLIPEPSMNYLIRCIAQRENKPFARAYIKWGRDVHGFDYRKFVTFIVPRRKYLSTIINPLMLAPERERRWSQEHGAAPLSWWCNTQDYYFFFADIQIWDDFAANMASDPDMRKALKLAPVT